jgi:hypothetical protein
MKEFKIRASQAGKIMTGTIGLTETQEAELEVLIAKPKRTAIQEAKMAELLTKKQGKELPQTLKTYCKAWLRSQVYERSKSIYSKYMEKGNVMEKSSLEKIADHLGLGMVFKNEEYFEDDFFCGTPDLLVKVEVVDAKNSWSMDTFPLLEDEIPSIEYFYQLQVYMHLTGRKKATLAYYLSNTPDNLIEREARYHCLSLGEDDVSEEVLEAFKEKMTYDHVPEKYRIKTFAFDYDPMVIEELKNRVKLCRVYIEELKKKFKIE